MLPMNCPMTAENLKALRVAADVDQRDLAARVGIPGPRLCEMEMGKRVITEVEALRLEAALLEMVAERNAAFEAARKGVTQ
jgi:transcriptional regulator with XRE-family HTH domain